MALHRISRYTSLTVNIEKMVFADCLNQFKLKHFVSVKSFSALSIRRWYCSIILLGAALLIDCKETIVFGCDEGVEPKAEVGIAPRDWGLFCKRSSCRRRRSWYCSIDFSILSNSMSHNEVSAWLDNVMSGSSNEIFHAQPNLTKAQLKKCDRVRLMKKARKIDGAKSCKIPPIVTTIAYAMIRRLR